MSGELSGFWEHGQGWARPTSDRSAWHLWRHGRTACGVYAWPAKAVPRMAGHKPRVGDPPTGAIDARDNPARTVELQREPPARARACAKCKARASRPLRRFWRYWRPGGWAR